MNVITEGASAGLIWRISQSAQRSPTDSAPPPCREEEAGARHSGRPRTVADASCTSDSRFMFHIPDSNASALHRPAVLHIGNFEQVCVHVDRSGDFNPDPKQSYCQRPRDNVVMCYLLLYAHRHAFTCTLDPAMPISLFTARQHFLKHASLLKHCFRRHRRIRYSTRSQLSDTYISQHTANLQTCPKAKTARRLRETQRRPKRLRPNKL